MGAKRDYYEVLGVPRNADDAAIKKAYRRLAKKYHPDTNAGDAKAEEKFKEITEAYNILSDKEKENCMINSAMLLLMEAAGNPLMALAVRAAPAIIPTTATAAPEALRKAPSISEETISSAIFSVIFSAVPKARAPEARDPVPTISIMMDLMVRILSRRAPISMGRFR